MNDDSIQTWIKDLSSELQEKLTRHGFTNNRFGIMGFGAVRPTYCGDPLTPPENSVYYFADDVVDDCDGEDIIVPINSDPDQPTPGVQEGTPRAIDFSAVPGTTPEILWTNDVVDIATLIDGGYLNVSGGQYEDGWWGLDYASEGKTVDNFTGGTLSNPTFTTEHDRYDFRKNAAVHFVLLSDEPFEPESRAEQHFDKTLDEMMTQMGHRRPELRDLDGVLFPEAPADPTGVLLSDTDEENSLGLGALTSIVPAFYKPGFVAPADTSTITIDETDPIFGIDADILDYYDVDIDTLYVDGDLNGDGVNDRDRNGDGTNDVPQYEFVAFVCQDCAIGNAAEDKILAVLSHTDLVVSTTNNGRRASGGLNAFNNADVYIGRDNDGYTHGVFNTLNPYTCNGVDYGYLPCDDPNEEVEILRDSEFSDDEIGQENFFAESYAFLTWELGGTVWDVDYVVGKLQLPIGETRSDIDGQNYFEGDRLEPDETLKGYFTTAVVDDIFEKLKLQAVDLDRLLDDSVLASIGSAIEKGFIGAADIDMITYHIATGTTTQNDILDLNQDESVDDEDRQVLIELILSTWYGDSNLDGLYTSSDNVVVFLAGEYEDTADDNSGWAEGDWSGDLDFSSGDFVFVFLEGGYQEMYRDIDGDGEEDFRPIWGKHLTSAIYRPRWG